MFNHEKSCVICFFELIKGPSINDVTLFWAKIYPLPPCHISSQVFKLPFKYNVIICNPPLHLQGAVHKWRHTILGINLPLSPLVTFRHKYLIPPSNITSQFAHTPFCNYKFPSILCLPRQKFHLFYIFDLCTLWQDQHSIRETSKILHTLLSKN